MKNNTYKTAKINFINRVELILDRMHNTNPSWYELSQALYVIEKGARRYGLLKEFRENGIL